MGTTAGDEKPLIQRLVGEPLVSIGRFGSMGVIGFGSQVSWPLPPNQPDTVGSRFAVHVQCPFRILQQERILLGSDDLLMSVAPGDEQTERLAYDIGASTLQAYLERVVTRVLTVEQRPVGDLLITLEHGIGIEVLPTSRKRPECWRLLARFGEHLTFPAG
ncbi:hypothetical protein ACIRBX_00175 [Kitasatospora sp. NPDC096147]|uniref:hypothetical protein n=1 Tax=Kitasatospora sp. NPDC096147 TaxID=3364093 RepID=UPI003802B2A0